MTTSYTAHLRLPIPDFTTEPWSGQISAAFDALDTALFNVLASANIHTWANSTVYAVGNMALDAITGQLFLCQVAHTSAVSPTTFSTDRINNPTFWANIQLSVRFRGAWQTGVIYEVNDVVYKTTGGQNIFAICTALHIAGSDILVDQAAGDWIFIFNGATLTTASAVSYNHGVSGLAASDVQAAIDEVVVDLGNRLRFDAVQTLSGGQQSQAQANLGLGTAALLTAGLAANNAVQLTGAAKYPAVDGSLITNIGGTLSTITTYSGSQTITIPAGCTKGKVKMWGGVGGSGGIAVTANGCSTGGVGGPGYLEKFLSGLTPGNTLAYTEGAAGAAGNNTGTNGTSGTDGVLASGSQTITTLTAHGSAGSLGNNANNTATAGTVGGTAVNGDTNRTGQRGFPTITAGIVGTVAVNGGTSPYSDGPPGVAVSTAATAGNPGSVGGLIIEWYR
jgi:hypothetical protein